MRPLRTPAVAVLLMALLLSLATTASADEAPVDHVNLGDSYSAGGGILPLAPGAPPAVPCAQSAANWAHQLATLRGHRLTDVSCSSATTVDFSRSQAPGVAPQLDALSPETDLVTMTTGGNDNNVFADLANRCFEAAVRARGRGDPCSRQFGSSFVDTIESRTYPALVRALQDVTTRAPHARVAISGYLRILPATTGCFPVIPIAAGDVPYVSTVQSALNDAVRRAAAATGVRYLEITERSTGHDACQPLGRRWVEPVVPINSAPLHPNTEGQRQMALNTIERLGL